MLRCQEVVELLTDFLENALPPARRAVVLAHLRECDDCLRYASQLQITGRVLGGLPVQELSAAERAALLDAYREWCAAQEDDASRGDAPSRRP